MYCGNFLKVRGVGATDLKECSDVGTEAADGVGPGRGEVGGGVEEVAADEGKEGRVEAKRHQEAV